MDFLIAKNISKSFNSHIALNSIDLMVSKGSIFALLGESGSGKSTLLRIMAGLLDADEGQVFLEEKEITGPKNHLVAGHDEIKLVSQNFDLFPNHSVAENILYPLRKYKDGYQDYRLKSMLKLCKLEDYAEQKPHTLSGGEQQRVALACALAPEPELILMDEPFSHLDAIFRTTLKKVLVEISHTTSTTLCLVTHESIDALSIADDIAILKNGEIIQKGNANAIYKQPKQEYIARLMGDINVLTKKTTLQLTEIAPEKLTNKKIIIRPENLKITNPDNSILHGKVKDLRLMGPYFKVELILSTEKELITVYSNKDNLKVGDVIGITTSTDKLILVDN